MEATIQTEKETTIMQPVPQDLLREYVKSQHFTSTADIMQAMKEMFRDVIQQVMEVEMDEELGHERCQRSASAEGDQPKNYRNGYSRKKVKTQLGEMCIRDSNTAANLEATKVMAAYKAILT